MTVEQRPVAIVTGVTRGLGRAVAQALVSAGWHVVGDGRNAELMKSVESTIDSTAFAPIIGDITDNEHLREMVHVAGSLGELRLVVNNAGGLGPSPMPAILDLKSEDLATLFEVNTLAALRLVQEAAPQLRRNGGVLINVTSDAGLDAYPGWGAYSMTKAALEKMTAILALECEDMTVYALDPGDLRTDMHQAAFPGEDISDRPEPEVSAPAVVELAKGNLPSGRYRAEDILKGTA